jgi:hypothetical protein
MSTLPEKKKPPNKISNEKQLETHHGRRHTGQPITEKPNGNSEKQAKPKF